MRVLPSIMATLFVAHAAPTCRYSMNVANIPSSTPAPSLDTNITPSPGKGNGTNTTLPPSTTKQPNATTPGTPGTTSDGINTPSPTTTAASGTPVPGGKTTEPTPVPTTTVPTTTTTIDKTTTTKPGTTGPTPSTTEKIARYLQVSTSTSSPTTTSLSTTRTPPTLANETTKTPKSTPATTAISQPSNAMTYDLAICDETFYSLWAKKGITCGGEAMDVTKVLNRDCTVYRGTFSLASISLSKVPACFSSCYIPACISNKWSYDDTLGIDSDIYKKLTFSDWFDTKTSLPPILSTVPMSSFTVSYSCDTYSMCTCPAANVVTRGNGTNANGTNPQNPNSSGSATANDVWADGTKKTNLDYAGQVTSSVSTSITYTTIAATTTMVIASSVGVVSSSATAAAAGVSTAGSASTAGTTLDIAQFAVCTSALSLPGSSRTLRLVGSQMSFSTFTWFSFGNDDTTDIKSRKLIEEYKGPREKESGGMFEYTSNVGIKPQMLLYVTLAGVASVICAVGVILGIVILVGSNLSCVKDKESFRKDCCDRAIGGLVLVAVISQYALGMVCMFQICLTLKNTRGAKVTAELMVALATLLVLAMGIIFYGLHIVRKHKEEIQDIGTAAHFDKSIHKRFGTLYDQYTFENRYFFVAKMSLALLSGMVTGTFAITGKTQLILLISMHIAFFLLLEVRKPHSARFVQSTSVMIVLIKVLVFGLSFFLLQAAQDNMPMSVQNIVSYVILALQLVVLICLLARQVYIFWKTRQIKNQKEEGVADEHTPPHLQMHAFDSIPGSIKHQQREWTSEYYSDQNCRSQPQQQQQHHQQQQQQYHQPAHQQHQQLREIRAPPTQNNAHVTGKRYDDGHDPNEYAI